MSKTYIPRAIETIAGNVLMEYDIGLVNGEPQEIPIEEIVEMHYGLILQYRNLSKTGIIHGITVFQDCIVPMYDEKEKRYEALIAKSGTILIDQRLTAKNRLNRLRFTLAHELAHYILHTEYYTESNENASKLNNVDSDMQTEKEADELAAAILMPVGRLKVACKRMSGKLESRASTGKIAV